MSVMTGAQLLLLMVLVCSPGVRHLSVGQVLHYDANYTDYTYAHIDGRNV